MEVYKIINIGALAFVLSGAGAWLTYTLKLKSLKPFDCEHCLGWWIGLWYFYNPGWDMVFMAAYSAIAASVIAKVFKKIMFL